MRFALMLGALLLAHAPAYAESTPGPLANGAQPECRLGPLKSRMNTALVINCPAEIQPLIDRAFSCQHWTGEEPYDEARGHEIETALAELKCDRLSLDHDALWKKYAKRADVIATLEAADREYSLEF